MKRAATLPFDALSKMPRCQALRMNTYFTDKPDTDKQCSHRSKYRVGNRFYCMRHAEIKALHLLMFEDDERIDGPLCVFPSNRTDNIDK
jgi:hypothetical protein